MQAVWPIQSFTPSSPFRPPPPQGEVLITSTSIIPDLIANVRLVLVSPTKGNATYIDLKCPPLVRAAASVHCAFDLPWGGDKATTAQVQLRLLTAKSYDTTSGTPKMVDFNRPESMELGNCLQVGGGAFVVDWGCEGWCEQWELPAGVCVCVWWQSDGVVLVTGAGLGV